MINSQSSKITINDLDIGKADIIFYILFDNFRYDLEGFIRNGGARYLDGIAEKAKIIPRKILKKYSEKIEKNGLADFRMNKITESGKNYLRIYLRLMNLLTERTFKDEK